MKKFAIAILFGAISLLMADGSAVYVKCIGCHGANGERVALGRSAVIQGQDASLTIAQINGYKAGTLNRRGMGGLMRGQVITMSDADIQAVANYIASK